MKLKEWVAYWQETYTVLRDISRRTGHSFQTIQKYAYQDNLSAEQLPNLEAENYPILEKYIGSIDEYTGTSSWLNFFFTLIGHLRYSNPIMSQILSRDVDLSTSPPYQGQFFVMLF